MRQWQIDKAKKNAKQEEKVKVRKTVIQKHEDHQFTLVEGPFEFGYVHWVDRKLSDNSIAASHPGKFMCAKCNVQIKWVNEHEISMYKQEYKVGMTYKEFHTRAQNYIKCEYEHSQEETIFLAVPFKDKDKAKQFGASWDMHNKLWYTTLRRRYAVNLIPWMMEDDIERLNKHLAKSKSRESFVNDESHVLGVSRLQRIFQKTPKNTP